jgi:hypothetical protein
MFTIKQYNTVPSLEATLVDHLNQPVNLTGASVKFSMRSLDNDNYIVDDPALISDALTGKVVYQWGAGDLNIHGAFIGEFTVTYSNGAKETFPNSDYIRINVVKSVGVAP